MLLMLPADLGDQRRVTLCRPVAMALEMSGGAIARHILASRCQGYRVTDLPALAGVDLQAAQMAYALVLLE